MIKRAKDVTHTNVLMTEGGLMPVKEVITDMDAEVTEIRGEGGAWVICHPYSMVETLNDFDSLDS
jgi:hypothetical protein